MVNCIFRPAVPGDEELILTFIRALADYEHMSDQVVATPELLREWIFEKKKAEVIFAESGERAVARPCSRSWPGSPWSGAAAGWNGPAWTGTSPPSTSTPGRCTPFPWTSGRCTV